MSEATITTTQTQTVTAPVTTWAIDPAHTEVGFSVRHMMVTSVRGRFSDVSGTIRLDEQEISRSSAEVTIGVASVDTREERRDAHLRSADFFDAERYPTMTFRSTRVESRGDDRLRVHGDLTIRDVTHPVVLDVEYNGRNRTPWGSEVIGFTATTKVNRKDFGLTYNVALETGGFVVGDDIKITLEIEATKQS